MGDFDAELLPEALITATIPVNESQNNNRTNCLFYVMLCYTFVNAPFSRLFDGQIREAGGLPW
jgi:hypothetical protein